LYRYLKRKNNYTNKNIIISKIGYITVLEETRCNRIKASLITFEYDVCTLIKNLMDKEYSRNK
jgi:hypothetical protein